MTRNVPVSGQTLQTILPLKKLRIFVYYRLTFGAGFLFVCFQICLQQHKGQ